MPITRKSLTTSKSEDSRQQPSMKVDKSLEAAPIQSIPLDNLLANTSLGGWVKFVDRDSVSLSDLSASTRIVIIAPRKMGKGREAAELISSATSNLILPTRIFTPLAAQVKLLGKNALQRELQFLPELAASQDPILLFIDNFTYDFKSKDLVFLHNLLDALSACVTNLYVVATARENHLSEADLTWLTDNQFKTICLPPLDGPKVGLLVDNYSAAEKITIDQDARKILVDRSDGTPELTLRSLRRMKDAGFSNITSVEAQKLTFSTMEEAIIADLQEFTGSHPAAPPLLDALAEFYAAGLDPLVSFVLPFTTAEMQSSPALRSQGQRTKALNLLIDEFAGKYLTIDRDRILIKDTLVEHIVDQNHARRHLSEFFLNYRRSYRNSVLRRLYPMAEQHAMALFTLALDAQNFDSHEQAINLYSSAITLVPHFGFYNFRGMVYADLQDYPAALADYTRAIELDPQYAEAYYNRGVTHAKLNDYAAARADYTNAIELDPQYAEAYNNRGTTYANQEDYSAALADFTKATEIDSKNVNAWYNCGVTQARQNEYKQAIESYDRALAIDAQKAEVWSNRGVALAELGKHKQAIDSYDQALKIDPRDALTWYNRGTALIKQGETEQAIESFEKALAINPRDADIQYDLARGFALTADENNACKWLELSIQQDKKYIVMAQDDTSFDPIRQSPLFQELNKRYSPP